MLVVACSGGGGVGVSAVLGGSDYAVRLLDRFQGVVPPVGGGVAVGVPDVEDNVVTHAADVGDGLVGRDVGVGIRSLVGSSGEMGHDVGGGVIAEAGEVDQLIGLAITEGGGDGGGGPLEVEFVDEMGLVAVCGD